MHDISGHVRRERERNEKAYDLKKHGPGQRVSGAPGSGSSSSEKSPCLPSNDIDSSARPLVDAA